MKISYNWLKSYIPKVPTAEKLVNIFNYHICEVEDIDKTPDGDMVFDLKILPNRAHDLLSHQGIARELASLLDIKYIDPKPKYKIPESKPTKLIKTIESSKCRRYMGRVIRNIKVGPSPEWMVKYLEAIGQRSVNNIVDATNIVMYDCGQPTHVFDLAKVKDLKLKVRNAKNDEKITLLGGEKKTLSDEMMVIADYEGNVLDIAGIKGGIYAELSSETTDIILEAANFDPVSVRKTAQALNITTDAKKRFENDLSPELDSYGMLELSALIYEMYPEAIFEDIIDIYPNPQKKRKLSFGVDRISSILGTKVSMNEIKNILKKYNFEYKNNGKKFEIVIPPMRLDLMTEEDMAEEIGRILGYDKIKGSIPKISFQPKENEIYNKILWARHKLLGDGYSEVMNSTFRDKGEVEVLASASDKNFLRTNLTDGLKEAIKLNQINAPLLELDEVKIFETGTVFKKSGEEIHVAYGDKNGIKEMKIEKYITENASSKEHGYFSAEKFLVLEPSLLQVSLEEDSLANKIFKMWSLFPFIARDVAVWVPEKVESNQVCKVIKENAGDLLVRGPEVFDEFKKDGKVSYAFRMVFQSYEHTLTDNEINEIMDKITSKIKKNKGWEVR